MKTASRSVRRAHAAALALALATAGAAATSTPSAAVTGCRPTGSVLSTTPTAFPLPGGADVRIWDTGHLADAVLETRVVAVRVPRGTLSPTVLAAPTIDSVRTPGQLAAGVPSAVLVVNGSVFDPVRLGIPTEHQIVNGRIRKASPTPESTLAVWGTDRRLGVVRSALAGRVVLGTAAFSVAGLNWQSVRTGGLTLYTTTWGRTSHPAGPVSVVVQGGKVVAKRSGSAARLPAATGQTIVTAPLGTLSTRLAAVRIGTSYTVALRESGTTIFDTEPTAMTAPTAMIMAGGTLVRDGANYVTTCSGTAEDVRPRTVVGFLDNGDLLVVAMSGRALVNGVRWGGATNHQAADYMVALGARTAIKLDGGTSTTLLVRRTVGGPLLRLDRSGSDYQRATPDSLAFLAPA